MKCACGMGCVWCGAVESYGEVVVVSNGSSPVEKVGVEEVYGPEYERELGLEIVREVPEAAPEWLPMFPVPEAPAKKEVH